MNRCEIVVGDALDVLRAMPEASVQCCVTSPPYWALRDYGVPGQLGLEQTFSEYLARLVAIFEEVRRVLRKDGTCWVNVGDSYNAYNANRGGSKSISAHADVARPIIGGPQGADRRSLDKNGGALLGVRRGGDNSRLSGRRVHKLERGLLSASLKNKDLIGQPWRLAFALQDAGWYLRSDIIWAKPNPMPESVTDRPTKAHEYLFLLAKSARYHYDAKAIAEQLATDPRENYPARARILGRGEQSYNGESARSGDRDKSGGFPPRTDKQSGHGRRHAGFNDRWDASEQNGTAPLMRNARSVWTIATRPFPEAHFATFPPELPRRCILAGTRPGDLVLDPFSGAGTTGLVANRLGRDFVGIELNPQYAAMARRRIAADAPLFNERSEP